MKRLTFLFLVLIFSISLSSCSFGSKIHKHEYKSWEVRLQPTCTEKGILYRACECGYEEIQEISALTHAYDSGIIIEEPTCEKRGLKNFTCKLCGKQEQKVMDTTAHTVNEQYDIITEETHAKRCMVCDKVTKEEEHYFYDGKCVVCQMPVEDLQ